MADDLYLPQRASSKAENGTRMSEHMRTWTSAHAYMHTLTHAPGHLISLGHSSGYTDASAWGWNMELVNHLRHDATTEAKLEL